MQTPLTCVILAGGQSTRMGQEKAFLDILGRPMIEWTLQALAGLGDEMLIVTNTPARYAYLGCRTVTDRYPGQGALGGLYTGLAEMSHEYALVVACDMPFLNRELLSYQVRLATCCDAVVPRIGRFSEPLHAVYSRRCVEPIGAALAAGQQRFFDVFQAIRVRYVEEAELDRYDPGRRSFMNVNTPADLESVRRLAAQLWTASAPDAAQQGAEKKG
jgi:molybdopterin-guanine dinucleotide biosynthesis protein A